MKKKGMLLTTAMAGLMMASCSQATTSSNSQAKAEQVMCYGVNSCKGHGQCAGKIDACAGKNGCEASMKCAGMNSCKGKGLKKMSKKECQSLGGKVALK